MVRVEAGILTSIDLGKVLTIDLPNDQTLRFRMGGDLDRFEVVRMDWRIDAVEVWHDKAMPVVTATVPAGLRDFYATLTLLSLPPITPLGHPLKLLFDIFVEAIAWAGTVEVLGSMAEDGWAWAGHTGHFAEDGYAWGGYTGYFARRA